MENTCRHITGVDHYALQTAADENPFSATVSGYGYVQNGELVSAYPEGSHNREFHFRAHEYFRDFVQGQAFPCIAGQSAIRSNNYAFCSYSDMEAEETAEGICSDLSKYMNQFRFGTPFNTFIAAFEGPVIDSQLGGVASFYKLLQNMHLANINRTPTTEDDRPDIDSSDFGFSIGGEDFFIPLFYPYASSETRKSDLLFIVFNGHRVFSELRHTGAFPKLKERIRARMGQPHPNLSDHGDGNQFIQFALVDPDEESQMSERKIRNQVLGSCPFSPTQKT